MGNTTVQATPEKDCLARYRAIERSGKKEILKMNNYPLQIFVDNDTAMMIQAFTDVGVSIDFDRLLRLMADNSEVIEDFIQSVEFNEPRMMLPIIDSNMKRLVIEQTNKYSISPERYLKAAIAILYADNILVTDSKVVH